MSKLDRSRLLAVDVFRGIAIAGMLLVNHAGQSTTVYVPFAHAAWHGWTPTDLIFPWFLFIVGASLTLSLGRKVEEGCQRTPLVIRALRRALVLIGLGLLLNGFPWWRLQLSTLRIPGVLQRIGLAFLAATPAVLWLPAWGQACLAAALLLGYWALLSVVPVPGVGAAVWQPGRDLGAFIDRAVFGSGHLCCDTWDPEGLLSTLPAIATVLLGGLTGHWLRSRAAPTRKVAGMLIAGLIGIALGILWGQVFPLNKNLWTSSFAVFTAGTALVVFAACYWLVDVKHWHRLAAPFSVLGVNAITVYVLSELADKAFRRVQFQSLGIGPVRRAIFTRLFASWLPPHAASLAFALVYALLWIGVMAVLHRRRIYLKV